LRSPWVRGAFVVAALALAGWALWRVHEAVLAALGRLPWWAAPAAAALTAVNVLAGAASWLAVVRDLGATAPRPALLRAFLVGQLGKYLPGSVWNVLAVSELARDHGVSRARAAASMLVMMAMTCVVAVWVAALALLVSPGVRGQLPGAVTVLAVAVVVLAPLSLHPRLLHLLLGTAARVLRRTPPAAPGARGVAAAAGWILLSWVALGLQVLVLLVGLGADPSPALTALAVGGMALAWVAGFVVLVVPAGLGVREVVLAVALAGAATRADVLVVVLLSRVLMTVVDAATGLVALVAARRASAASGAGGDDDGVDRG
ncbi:lysylphosphatidylglycerol synthase domain-containing protein, partial [Angustibacter speluncae]